MQHDIEFVTVSSLHKTNKLSVTSPFQNGGKQMKKKKKIIQTLFIVIKLFVLFTTYNLETGMKNVVPDTEPFQ